MALEMDPGTRVFITLPLFPVNRLAGGKAAVLTLRISPMEMAPPPIWCS